jgi:hypothetical protein
MLALKRSLLNREQILINVLKALASIISMCTLEYYTEIFYMIDEGDIPSIQYKMSLRGIKSMKKENVLSLTFIDFHVPAFTTRTHRKHRSFSYANRFHGIVFVSPSNGLFIKNLLP